MVAKWWDKKGNTVRRARKADLLAVQRFHDWREQGVPFVVTSSEAHRLTNGKVGVQDDHWTALSLVLVAKRFVR